MVRDVENVTVEDPHSCFCPWLPISEIKGNRGLQEAVHPQTERTGNYVTAVYLPVPS